MSEVLATLGEEERSYDFDDDCSYNSATTITLDLETLLKVTELPLP